MTTVEITDVSQVREGDVVTLAYEGHEFTGQVWREFDGLRVGGSFLSSPFVTFVRATREVPDLPTEPGSVIFGYGDDHGHPFARVPLMLFRDDHWVGVGPTGNPINVRSADIVGSDPARIVAEEQP